MEILQNKIQLVEATFGGQEDTIITMHSLCSKLCERQGSIRSDTLTQFQRELDRIAGGHLK